MQEASVFHAKALCRFGDERNWEASQVVRTMEATAVGKFSHLFIEGGVTDFDFGPVYVGKSAEKSFVIRNESPVYFFLFDERTMVHYLKSHSFGTGRGKFQNPQCGTRSRSVLYLLCHEWFHSIQRQARGESDVHARRDSFALDRIL
jgi:hypothetical protein